MSFTLIEVRLPQAWNAFLARCEGWHESGRGCWTDGRAVVRIVPDGCTCEAIVAVRHDNAEFRLCVGETVVSRQPAAQSVAKNDAIRAGALLNHLAMDLPLYDTVVRRWIGEDATSFLDKASRFDPSVGKNIVAEHLVDEDGDYLTLRYLPDIGGPRLSHIGFQFSSKSAFFAHQRILGALGWPVLVPPTVIDGSLLTHFRSPDGMVHDLFHVIEPRAAV